MVYASRIFLIANDRARDQTSDPTQCLWMKAGGTTKAAERKMCVFPEGSTLGRLLWRREWGLCWVTRSAIAGVCEECCESGGCARLHARSCLSSCIPSASVCRLSAGASGVNAGRISLSVGRGHWMAAFHGQQKHWLRVRADLRLLRKHGLELWFGSGVGLTGLACVIVVGPCNGSRQYNLSFCFY